MTLPSLSGTLKVDFPEYVLAGEEINVLPTGFYRNDETDTLLTLYWVHPISGARDTVRTETDPDTIGNDFIFEVPTDTVGKFTLSIYVAAEGYSLRSTVVSFTILNTELDEGSLRGYGFLDELNTFEDTRDSYRYYYTTAADGHDWMISNLAWNGAGDAFSGEEALSRIYGRYYTWNEAVNACPEGWHLPSDADIINLALAYGGTSSDGVSVESGAGALMGNIYMNGSRMWEFWPDVRITNASRLSLIPAGLAKLNNGKALYGGLNDYAFLWTSDEVDGVSAKARYIYMDKPAVFVDAFGKESVRASVRCMR